ncbi:sodium/nucleoside cotransporter [Cordyceps javanica]|uniref:Protein HRI1 n=1 Tax=Cordyceps javanica TaxID=43265 RepID=A0A545VVG3_9HYPO|nr:sodium/nucleoside cotransporter [Cordyceps javanica]TQW05705.1 sodium/nucleoside cotransporter [Cordyceps javanica]
MGTVSHRKYIRWYPDEASEPTSTVVLTSPENHFVDLRILLPPDGAANLSNEPATAGELPLDRLDWAIAGTTISEAATAPTGEPIRRSTFCHWVSSRDADPAGVSDVGDMYPQEDGTTLEKGTMVNPATGRATGYDELWYDLLAPTSDFIAVLRVDAGAVKGMLVWIGALCQALVRDEHGIALERWERVVPERGGAAAAAGGEDEDEDAEEEETWTRTVRMGSRQLPCESILTGKVTLETNGVVACQGDMWQVVELHA